MPSRSLVAIALALSGTGCVNYAAASDPVSTRTFAALTAVELTVPACAALVPFNDKAGKLLPYPLRYAILIATAMMLDWSVAMLWNAE